MVFSLFGCWFFISRCGAQAVTSLGTFLVPQQTGGEGLESALPVPAQPEPSPGLLSEPGTGGFLLGAAHESVALERETKNPKIDKE